MPETLRQLTDAGAAMPIHAQADMPVDPSLVLRQDWRAAGEQPEHTLANVFSPHHHGYGQDDMENRKILNPEVERRSFKVGDLF